MPDKLPLRPGRPIHAKRFAYRRVAALPLCCIQLRRPCAVLAPRSTSGPLQSRSLSKRLRSARATPTSVDTPDTSRMRATTAEQDLFEMNEASIFHMKHADPAAKDSPRVIHDSPNLSTNKAAARRS